MSETEINSIENNKKLEKFNQDTDLDIVKGMLL